MPAFDSAQASASTGTVSDRVLLDALVVVAARRIVLGVDVAAAKFLSGQRVDDLVREQEILESMASTLKRAELQHPLRIEFFRDQIEANKVIQRGLYRYWCEHPEEFPVKRRRLTAELRPQLSRQVAMPAPGFSRMFTPMTVKASLDDFVGLDLIAEELHPQRVPMRGGLQLARHRSRISCSWT